VADLVGHPIVDNCNIKRTRRTAARMICENLQYVRHYFLL